MADEEKNDCPKCDKPPTTYRYKGGVKQLICGSGHNWPSNLDRTKEENAKKAENSPGTLPSAWGIPGQGVKYINPK